MMNNSAPSLESHRYGPETYGQPNGARPIQAKIVTCKQEGNPLKAGVRVAISSKNYRSFETLLTDLTSKMPDLGHGVRSVYTSRGRNRVQTIDQFENGKQYICCQSTSRRPRMAVGNSRKLPEWRGGKPPSGRRAYSFSLRNDTSSQNGRPPPTTRYQTRSYPGSDTDQSPQPYSVSVYNRVDCKRIIVRKNGEPHNKHVVLINKKAAHSFEKIVDDLCDMFHMSVRRLYTLDGEPVESLSAIYNGPDEYIASDTRGLVKTWVGPPINGHVKKRSRARDAVMEEAVNQRQKKARSKGFWTVCVTTRAEPESGTTASVSITVQGSRGCSGPIPLTTTVGDGIVSPFEAGNKDEFKISVGNIGEVRKIRLSHDNTGDSPSWYVGEVLMIDIHSEEQLVFRFDRWLSRDHDHGEICREMPAVRQGKPLPTVLNYYVTVHTGECYNAGTDANVSVNLTGDNGDTGPRQLCKADPPKEKLFQKGSVDTFVLEAVELGKLQKLLISHDAVGAGFGWFLEKVVVAEGNRPEDTSYTFPCNGWLDEGEGFGKTTIELTPAGPPRADKHDEVMWEAEKWKFASGNEVQFFNKATEQALRFNPELKVDALGEEKDAHSVFTVIEAQGVNFNLQSRDDPSLVLGLVNGQIANTARPGPNTAIRVHMNPDRSVRLTWAKKGPQGHQSLAFNTRGLTATSGSTAAPEGDVFVPFVKGMFRQGGVIMFCTSVSQTLTVEHNAVHGTGKKNRMAHFLVHKVDEGRVRMFESVVFRDQFLRIKDGRCDCLGTGDASCQFRVDVYKDRSFVTLQSVAQHGLCIGMADDGRVIPMADQGEAVTRFFPEVITFGTPRAPIDVGTPIPRDGATASPPSSPTRATPRIPTPSAANSRPPSMRRRTPPAALPEESAEYQDDEWRLCVQSAGTASPGASVAVYLYGWTTNSGRIQLGSTGTLFQANNRDEFKISLKDLGELIKIRVELEPTDYIQSLPTWSLQQVFMEHPSSGKVLTFDFGGASFSLEEEEGSLARELAVDGVLPKVRYSVAVETSELPNAGTTANVFMVLFGDHGDTGRRLLRKMTGEPAFQAGSTDHFVVEAVHLGTVKRCLIAHDGQTAGAGWHCARVTINDSYDGKDYVFPCERWLDAGEDDAKIERVLRPSGSTSASTFARDKSPAQEVPLTAEEVEPPKDEEEPPPAKEDEPLKEEENPPAKEDDPPKEEEEVPPSPEEEIPVAEETKDNDPQMDAIRKDDNEDSPQELIDDVTERVAKRIEDHHSRES